MVPSQLLPLIWLLVREPHTLSSHVSQLHWADVEPFPGQLWDKISSNMSCICSGVSYEIDKPRTSPLRGVQGASWPNAQTTLTSSTTLASPGCLSMCHPLSKARPCHPSWKLILATYVTNSCSFGHYPKLVMRVRTLMDWPWGSAFFSPQWTTAAPALLQTPPQSVCPSPALFSPASWTRPQDT